MSTIYMVKNIKELFPEYVLLVKIGTFYESYNHDAYIISYLFNYKMKTLIDGDKNCGFPFIGFAGGPRLCTLPISHLFSEKSA